MEIETKRKRFFRDIKQPIENRFTCPVCNQRVEIGVELGVLRKLDLSDGMIFSHIHLHGDPLHAILCLIDTHLVVRSMHPIESVEILGDMKTFTSMTKKWSNPL